MFLTHGAGEEKEKPYKPDTGNPKYRVAPTLNELFPQKGQDKGKACEYLPILIYCMASQAGIYFIHNCHEQCKECSYEC